MTQIKSQEIRKVYQTIVSGLMINDPAVVMIDADLTNASGSMKTFVDHQRNCINVGISEANMIGVCAGLSYTGLKPFAHTFAPFMARRALDQITLSLAYAQGSLHMYASDPGFWALHNGGTHTTFEDIAIMAAIANVTVVAPSDPVSFAWVLEYYYREGGVIYNRAPRKELDVLYRDDESFALGRAKVLHHGRDIAIIGVGSMMHEVLKADTLLRERGYDCTLVDWFSIKPFDRQLIAHLAATHDKVVVVENHNLIGGVGSMIGAYMATLTHTAVLRHVAVADRFGEVGTKEYLMKILKLSAQDIIDAVCGE